jgi:hypothetical protein
MAESRRLAQKLRCAIYTRKSSEEGLEQAFNSLDAQREACLRDFLLALLQRFEDEAPGIEFLSAEARTAYDALPDPVNVFRGCPREQVLAITWTTDQEIAAGFAHGIAL